MFAHWKIVGSKAQWASEDEEWKAQSSTKSTAQHWWWLELHTVQGIWWTWTTTWTLN